MPVEIFNYIDSLNTANPTSTDNVSEGDDHIRGIKTTLKNTFPNVNGAINATDEELNYVDGVTSAIQTQLDGKEPADATILKDADIGVNVQAYDADTAKTDVAQTFTASQAFGDNVKAKFGAGDDLQIYHNGSHSIIADNGTGNLQVYATDFQLLNNAAETYLSAQSNGAVRLSYDNSEKLVTTANGIDVTGRATVDSANCVTVVDNDGSFDMNGGNNFKCTPTGNFTLTFTNITDGQSGFILLVNSGGQTVSAHTNTKVDANLLTTVSTASTYLLSYFSDGTNVYITNSAAYT